MTDEFQVVVHTLRELDKTEQCPTAHGYLVFLTEFRFLSTLYLSLLVYRKHFRKVNSIVLR